MYNCIAIDTIVIHYCNGLKRLEKRGFEDGKDSACKLRPQRWYDLPIFRNWIHQLIIVDPCVPASYIENFRDLKEFNGVSTQRHLKIQATKDQPLGCLL